MKRQKNVLNNYISLKLFRNCTVLRTNVPRTTQYLTECAVFGLQPLLTVSDTSSINTYNSIRNNPDRKF